MSLQRLLIFGGTFDPPHRAHVELPACAADQIHADRIIYIPTGQPPHKTDHRVTDATHRLAMLQLVLADSPMAEIETYEIQRPQTSYTVDTLEYLRMQHRQAEMRLLIGTDQALAFSTWRQPDRVVELAKPLVMVRPPDDIDSFIGRFSVEEQAAWRSRVVECPIVDISSSQLRRLLADRPDDQLIIESLFPAVREYIRDHGLYR